MCLSLQNTSSVGVHDVNSPGAERDEGELADQSDKKEMDEEESECMHVHFYSVIASIFRFRQM